MPLSAAFYVFTIQADKQWHFERVWSSPTIIMDEAHSTDNHLVSHKRPLQSQQKIRSA